MHQNNYCALVAGLTLLATPGISLAQVDSNSSSAALGQPIGPVPAGLGPSTQAASSGAGVVLLSSIPGLPQSNVPGLPGVVFNPGTAGTGFDRIYGSPNGNWIVTGVADLPTSEDEVLIVNGNLVLQEGQSAPWTGGTENVGPIETRCDVNDSGDFVFATNTDGTFTADDYLVSNVAGAWVTVAQEGDPIPSLPGGIYGDLLGNALILEDGMAGFRADLIDGTPPASEDELLVLAGMTLLQEGVSVPSGQAGGGTETLGNLDVSDFWATEDGQHYAVQGDLNGPITSDDVIIVDGNVVLQEGSIIPSSPFVDPIDQEGIVGVYMDSGGNWYARGSNANTDQDWVVQNGDVVAAVDMPIVPGAAESFDDSIFSRCFFLQVGNSAGDYIVGGVTDNADLLRNAVLVLNGTEVLCRESDPVDLDGNGVFDDDAFIDIFDNDDGHLADDGSFIFVARIKNGMGIRVGSVLLDLDTGAGSPGTNFCVANANSTGVSSVIGATGSSLASDNDLTLTASNLPTSSFVLFITSQMSGFVQNPGGSAGNLCLIGSIGRYVAPGQVQNSGATGMVSLALDLNLTPTPNGLVSVQPGETWFFQAWHRDSSPSGPSSNFTDGLEVNFQ